MDATPENIQATWDFWSTIEAGDLTEIAATENSDLAEMDGTSTAMAHFWETVIASETAGAGFLTVGTPVTTESVYVTALPDTGSGSGHYLSVSVALFILLAMLCGVVAMRLRRA